LVDISDVRAIPPSFHLLPWGPWMPCRIYTAYASDTL